MVDDFSDLIPEENRRQPPKNPKAAARRRYNRCKDLARHALEQLDMAVDVLLAQSGTIYKAAEAEMLKKAIADFIETTGLTAPEIEPLDDGFLDRLANAPPYVPPSKEEMDALFASLGLDAIVDDRDDESE